MIRRGRFYQSLAMARVKPASRPAERRGGLVLFCICRAAEFGFGASFGRSDLAG